jgi:uncharacterized protein (TIGR00299 family) protein
MHVHLDLIGGLSGDMFISAMLDCFPEAEPQLATVMVDAGFAELVRLESLPADDGTLTGTRFRVHADHDAEGHHHRHYSEIRRILEDSRLQADVRKAALDMFEIIAVAEAAIHGKEVDAVAFHEVGAWDSIADIVCAAYLIASCGVTSWSVSKLPIGRGRVKTAHGILPVPAPATSLILQGFETIDDGIEGERITPTGAAILKFLAPDQRMPSGLTLGRTGTGFGTRQFPGLSNVVRALVLEGGHQPQWDTDQVTQLSFEIDDQTPEAISVAVDDIRNRDGVMDVIVMPYTGKKGRQGNSIRVLVRPDVRDEVLAACFQETATLGIRCELVTRAVLRRQPVVVDHDGRRFRIKVADRPGGKTAKVEMDDLQTVKMADRDEIRRVLESRALDEVNDQTE